MKLKEKNARKSQITMVAIGMSVLTVGVVAAIVVPVTLKKNKTNNSDELSAYKQKLADLFKDKYATLHATYVGTGDVDTSSIPSGAGSTDTLATAKAIVAYNADGTVFDIEEMLKKNENVKALSLPSVGGDATSNMYRRIILALFKEAHSTRTVGTIVSADGKVDVESILNAKTKEEAFKAAELIVSYDAQGHECAVDLTPFALTTNKVSVDGIAEINQIYTLR